MGRLALLLLALFAEVNAPLPLNARRTLMPLRVLLCPLRVSIRARAK
jgi:hypothetical protein